MKNLIAISILLGFGLMITLNSCKKKEEEKTPAALTSTATITGKVKADLTTVQVDGVNKTENAPSGTKIFVTFSSRSLMDSPQYDDKTLTYETIVGSNGSYSISIPAGTKPFDITISGNEFIYMQGQPSPNADVRTKYKITPRDVANIIAGKTVIEDFTYIDSPAVE